MVSDGTPSHCDRCDRIEILGQVFSYPRTVWAAASVAFVVLGICFIVWVVATHEKALETLGQVLIARAGPNTTEVIGSRYLIEFWTPSARTKEGTEVPDWEKVDSDTKLDAFADELFKDERLHGYRRYEITGRGLSSRRVGAWWVLTADISYKPTDLVRAYQKFWQTDSLVYIEVLRPAGTHERNEAKLSE